MSRFMDFISLAFRPNSETSSTSIIVTTALATFAVVTASRLAFREKKVKIIKSPAATLLPNLSQAEKDALPYPPDAYPGGRDVNSPYGTIKVYEWGPEDGRKVLFVHGITTSCLAIGAVAHGLVERGCRVMIFDLWGRGYSDSCADLSHDERLYSTQILLAITSSPLSWTGESGFSLIGYSLGGGISVAFTSYFPNMVNSLVLLTPTGLIRANRLAGQKKLIFFANLLPNSILEIFLKRRLQHPLFPKENKDDSDIKVMTETVAEAEVKSEKIINGGIAPVSLRYPNVTVLSAIQWQIQVHAGFLNSFMSTVRHALEIGQPEAWKRLRLRKDKILIIAASHDPIIKAEELKEDAMEVLGADKLEWRLIDGAHDIPITEARKIVSEICGFWKY